MGYAFNESSDHRAKPDGGYVLVSTLAIGLLTWARMKGLLSLRAVRIGFALYEMRLERRLDALKKRKQGREVLPSHFSTKELGRLCGLPQKRVKAALNELLALGFLAEFSPTEIRFATSLEATALTSDQLAEFRSWLPALTKRRRVPIPRRILKILVETSSPALLITILGVSIRCSWLKEDGFSYSGRFSCSWASQHFGVCLRAIQSAKALLVGLGWIRSQGLPLRIGDRVAINPAWHRLLSLPETEGENTEEFSTGQAPEQGAGPADGTKSAGVNPSPGTKSAGALLPEESSPKERFKYQRQSPPEPKPGPGVSNPNRGEKNQDQPPENPPPPRLSAIRPEDLASIERLLGERSLFAQAVKAKILNDCEADRLYFVACAERARTTVTKNPCGLFIALWKDRRKFGGYISVEQEDAARLRIRAWERPENPGDVPFLVPAFPVATAPPAPRSSKDATVLRAVRGHGVRDLETAFPTLRAKYGWDRPRFVAALAELENRQLSSANAV